jgi:hypothetical protein
VGEASGGQRIGIANSTWRPGDLALAALCSGVLAINDDGCLYLIGRDTSTDLLWPAEYTAERLADGTAVVRRPNGTIAARTGHRLIFGGGMVDAPPDMPRRAGAGQVLAIHHAL